MALPMSALIWLGVGWESPMLLIPTICKAGRGVASSAAAVETRAVPQ